jgi:hypothetical protein
LPYVCYWRLADIPEPAINDPVTSAYDPIGRVVRGHARPHARVYLDKHKHRVFLANGDDLMMRLIIEKRKNIYEGIEGSRSLTKNSNDLASYRKTRVGSRH